MTWSHAGYGTIAALLNRRTGLQFPCNRQDSAEVGMRRAMARAGVAEFDRYLALLDASAESFDDLVVELTVGETYFFREPEQFAFLRREALPEIRRRRGPTHRLRAWSAACASGEEAYSLAITLREEGFDEDTYLLATDISSSALQRARRATYRAWSLRGEETNAAARYLRPQGERLLLADVIHRRVTFAPLNLALDDYPSAATAVWQMDVIFCRNVLIYLDPQSVAAVARRLFASLAPGGWLITASCDPALNYLAPLEVVTTSRGVYYRRPLEPLSPEGATVNSQGCQPLEPGPMMRPSPEGATVQATHAGTVTPSGLDRRDEVGPRGSRPWLLTAAPLGLAEQEPNSLPRGEALDAVSDPLPRAEAAFRAGNYTTAAALLRDQPGEAAGVLLVRALANLGPDVAEKACAVAVARHPLSAELHYLRTVLLLDLGRPEAAIQAVRRVLFLDRTLAVAHFMLGTLLQPGDRAAARRAFATVQALCSLRSGDECLPLADGTTAEQLSRAAAERLARLDTVTEALP